VILDYAEYEKMYDELDTLRELAWEYEVVRRLDSTDSTAKESISLKDLMDEKEYAAYLSQKADIIPDDELFED
jgi:hypothetical protein